MTPHTNHPPLQISWMVWGLGALLYLIGFYQRVAPGVMTSELMVDFSLSAIALGNLSAFYFYSYVAMQVPTGLLADHWGPRRLLTLGATVAAIGTLIFAHAPELFVGERVSFKFRATALHNMPDSTYLATNGKLAVVLDEHMDLTKLAGITVSGVLEKRGKFLTVSY